eukprot:10606345-Ditylum_brightwellii.AAC.1
MKKRKLGQHERQSKRGKLALATNKKVRTQQEQKRKIMPEENEEKLTENNLKQPKRQRRKK